jgi:hypothetical protein
MSSAPEMLAMFPMIAVQRYLGESGTDRRFTGVLAPSPHWSGRGFAPRNSRHLAIVDPLLVARLAAEPLLGGSSRLDVARFGVGARCRIGGCRRHQQEERPRHGANRGMQYHPRRIAHRRAFRFDRGPVFGRDRSVCHEHR